MEERNYKVYMHICPNGKKYIGITKQEVKKRWGHGSSYKNNKYFTNAIKKYKWENIEHKILYINLTKTEAEEKEKELIKLYKTTNQKYGYNILSGGNVSNGLPKEVIEKISNKKRGIHLSEEHKEKIKNTLKGRKMSDEWKKKISNSLKGKPKSKEAIEKSRLSKIGKPAWNKGKYNIYNDKQLAKMSENTKKLWKKEEYRNKNCKKVLCIELNMVFNSVTEAKKYFNMKSNSHICECCSGKLKSCGKYNGKKLHWKYIN